MPDEGAVGECPIDGSALTEIGEAGILDPDKRWEAQTTRYRCEHGHMIFVAESEPIDTAEGEEAKKQEESLPPLVKKPFVEEVMQEYPPIGKYRVRLLHNTKHPEGRYIDIREYVSAEKFEGFTRRGIRISTVEQADILRDVLTEIIASGKLKA